MADQETSSEVFEFVCDKCNKKITSLSASQFKQNVEQHKRFCAKEKKDAK